MNAAADDVIIVGGGHNGLVAAAYLARAGRRVTVLEGRGALGGAVAGDRIFPGVDARLSRFSYLVSLLPRTIVNELGLDIELRSRPVRSYTPVGDGGVLVSRDAAEISPLDESLHAFAAVLEPTLTQPLPRAADLRARLDPGLWAALVERPIGALIESSSADDAVRGVLLTDALIGTFSYAHDPSLRQNRCFLYHVIGNGTGEWRVPVGGMGAVADELVRAATGAGANLVTNAPVAAIEPSETRPDHHPAGRWPSAIRRPRAGQLRPGRARPAGGQPVARSGGQPAQDQHAAPPTAPAAFGTRPRDRLRRHPAPRSGLRPPAAGVRDRGRRAHPGSAALRGVLPHAHRPLHPRRRTPGPRLPHADPVRSAHADRPLPGRSGRRAGASAASGVAVVAGRAGRATGGLPGPGRRRADPVWR